ncbi:hypothetical protein QNO09_26740 [Streptomyces sp. 378]|uniref:hypothetical protein n=1 Tax=Streptomyces sp. 378 TaxID=3049412 RepID=UPI0024C2D28C|nr:hypothetical protein [Streptomyces sp. 378]MDK1346841.1 hypothetical protein [Streptomyces sp. 378]
MLTLLGLAAGLAPDAACARRYLDVPEGGTAGRTGGAAFCLRSGGNRYATGGPSAVDADDPARLVVAQPLLREQEICLLLTQWPLPPLSRPDLLGLEVHRIP